MLSPSELQRYHRQILLPEFGTEGQQRLQSAKILVIGAGGLGSPILLYLAAAGVGTLGICEYDNIDETNLQRQILYQADEAGKPKSETAAHRIRGLNPHIRVNEHPGYLTAASVLNIIRGYDIVVDGSDNLPTRYLVNDACVLEGKPLVYGAIYRFEGQVSVFNQLLSNGERSADYRDLFPEPPPPDMVPSCAQAGVLGSLAGMIGSMMANEALKLAAGFGSTLHSRLLLLDALDMSVRTVNIQRLGGRLPITGLMDYESFCDPQPAQADVREMSPSEARAMLDGNKATVLDVREPEEFAQANIGGTNLPLGRIMEDSVRIPRRSPVIVVCRSGSRGRQAIRKLEDLGFSNLINMRGGLNRWRSEINNQFPPC